MWDRGTWAFGVAALAAFGCGGAATSTASSSPPAAARDHAELDDPSRWWAEGGSTASSSDRELPAPPWAEAPLADGEATELVVKTWSEAENRDWCAPMFLNDTAGAVARPVPYEGGWAVEFDHRGLPGVTARGRACRGCGRGAYGIAGTAVAVDEEGLVEGTRLSSWSDGSFADLETAADAAVASIKVKGQGCVYQIWS